MVNQSTLPTLFRAISNLEIEANLKTLNKPLMESLQILLAKFLQSVATPVETHRFEQDIEKTVREFARSVVQWCYGALETENIQDMPGAINYRDHSYRRMRDKTNHSQILTLFGTIQLIRATYRRGRAAINVPSTRVIINLISLNSESRPTGLSSSLNSEMI